MQNQDPTAGAKKLTSVILEKAGLCIKRKLLRETKSTHPWLNDRVLQAVEQKRGAEGSEKAREMAAECSKVILNEYKSWCDQVGIELRNMRPGSKAWWAKEKQLQHKKQKACSIPALKSSDGQWVRSTESKANLLAKTFQDKYSLPVQQVDKYSLVENVEADWDIDPSVALSVEAAEKELNALREDSATGPYLLPTRILEQCANTLALPVYFLALSILRHGVRPRCWGEHWATAIYKKECVRRTQLSRRTHDRADCKSVRAPVESPFLTSVNVRGQHWFQSVCILQRQRLT